MNYASKYNKHMENNTRFTDSRNWVWREGKLEKGSQKVPTPSYKISTRYEIYNMVTLLYIICENC